MTLNDKELADFQECLLNALHDHESASAILAAMESNETTLPFREYISSFEPEMLEVAASLVKKWSIKHPPSDIGNLHKMPH